MSAVLIGTRCRHVNVIPVKADVTNRGIVKTIATFLYMRCVSQILSYNISKYR